MTTVQFPLDPDDELFEYIAGKAGVCGGGAYEIWEHLCEKFGLQATEDPEAFNAWLHQVVAMDWDINGVCTKTQRMQRMSLPEIEAAQKAWTARGVLMALPAFKEGPDSPPTGYKPCSPELLESGVDCATAPRWSAKEWDGHSHWHPAPMGEPVAWQHRVTAGPQTGWSLWAPGRGKEYAEHYTVEVRPLYAEQPAPVLQKYDDTLLPFLALMRAELHANSHKGDREGWLRMTLGQAQAEILHHFDKLIVPVMNQDREAIREHAADVANCAMMLADIAGVLSRE